MLFPVRGVHQRNYNAAQESRLTADWQATTVSADLAMRGKIRVLRNRARSLERDNDYARRFFKLL
ncbi:MAG: phage portal protein [Verrucomicrobiales bacterium]|nr:phage portal protein [Verrucomicrobiales bacterium]